MTPPREPTSDECTANAPIPVDDERSIAFAAWYPQMGGYGSKCVIVFDKDSNPVDQPCFSAYVWHDGAFPFSRDTDIERLDYARSPAHLHHCCAEQFVHFGQKVAAKLEEIATAAATAAPDDARQIVEDVTRNLAAARLGGTVEDTKAAVLAAVENIPGFVPGSVTVEVEDIEDDDDYETVEKTPGPLADEDEDRPDGIDVDATWRTLRRPAANLAEYRAIVQGATDTEDIAVYDEGFAVTDESAVPVARFLELTDARAFLSARAVLDMWAAAERRAELAESRVRGLEQTLADLRTYDEVHAGKDPEGNIDAHAAIDLSVAIDSEYDRVIAVTSEDGLMHDDVSEDFDDPPFYVSGREARCLAASLLRAADQFDAALARRARGEVTSEDQDAANEPTPTA